MAQTIRRRGEYSAQSGQILREERSTLRRVVLASLRCITVVYMPPIASLRCITVVYMPYVPICLPMCLYASLCVCMPPIYLPTSLSGPYYTSLLASQDPNMPPFLPVNSGICLPFSLLTRVYASLPTMVGTTLPPTMVGTTIPSPGYTILYTRWLQYTSRVYREGRPAALERALS